MTQKNGTLNFLMFELDPITYVSNVLRLNRLLGRVGLHGAQVFYFFFLFASQQRKFDPWPASRVASFKKTRLT